MCPRACMYSVYLCVCCSLIGVRVLTSSRGQLKIAYRSYRACYIQFSVSSSCSLSTIEGFYASILYAGSDEFQNLKPSMLLLTSGFFPYFTLPRFYPILRDPVPCFSLERSLFFTVHPVLFQFLAKPTPFPSTMSIRSLLLSFTLSSPPK